MSVTVKGFRYNDVLGGQPTEIRRFTLDQALVANFTTLKTKIQQVFAGLNDGFGLFWKDPEGDFISFSSDDELLEALGNVTDNIFRVHVMDRATSQPTGGNTQQQQQQQSGAEHPGVYCDGCEGKIVGYRYKCVECPDYDLCQTCEGKGVHSEHLMMRFTKPMEHPFMPPFFRRGRGGRCGNGGPPGHHGGPHHGGPHHGPPPFFAGPPHGGPQGGPPPPPPPEGGCPFTAGGPPGGPGAPPFTGGFFMGMGPGGGTWSGGMGPGGPWVGEPMGRFWRKCRRQARAHARAAAQGQNQENQQESTEPMSEGAGQNEDTGDNDTYNGEDYLKDMGETVAAFLEPFGIDVAVDIEHGGKRERVNRQRGPAEPQPTTSNAEQPKEQMDVDQSTGETATRTGPQAPSAEIPTPAPDSSGTTSNQGDNSGNRSETEWTFVIPPDTVPEPAVADPKIQKALTMMKGMGFNDDGGWLTRLLIAKDGDIIKVLDAIKPQPNNSANNA